MSILDPLKKYLRKYTAFKAIPAVVDQAYMRGDGGKVIPVDPAMVASAAATLEAALVMSETLPPGHVMTVNFSVDELNSFVCYMRQLDSSYRDQGQFIARHIKPLSWSPEKSEFQTTEEAAQISAERYEQLTGQVLRNAPHPSAGQ